MSVHYTILFDNGQALSVKVEGPIFEHVPFLEKARRQLSMFSFKTVDGKPIIINLTHVLAIFEGLEASPIVRPTSPTPILAKQ